MGDEEAISMTDLKKLASKKHIPICELLVLLKCTEKGLSSYEASKRLQIFGENKFDEKKILGRQKRKIFQLVSFAWNPISWVMELLCLADIVLALSVGRPLYSLEFVGTIMLLAINSAICLMTENYARYAGEALFNVQPAKTKVLRDGFWMELDATLLVPGDIIYIKQGDVVHADICLLKGDYLLVGHSPPNGAYICREKSTGDRVLYGCYCRRGEMKAVVIATGVRCLYPNIRCQKNIFEVAQHEKILKAVSKYLICLLAVAMVIQVAVMSLVQSRSHYDIIDNILALLIGGLPTALPSVMFVTMAVGSHTLSKLGIVIKHLSAIEGMSRMDVLCINKTGSLTLNMVSGYRNLVQVFEEGVDKEYVILLAARASQTENQDAIDAAIVRMLNDPKEARAGIVEVHFQPFLTANRLTAITYEDANGNWHCVTKGSPKMIMDLCKCSIYAMDNIYRLINKFSKDGFRFVAVARQEVHKKELKNVTASLFNKKYRSSQWQFVGMIPLFDPLRHDSVETVRQFSKFGVRVKMITGDEFSISKEMARRLGIGPNIYPASLVFSDGIGKELDLPILPSNVLIQNADGIAELSEGEKYETVCILQCRNHICGMVGTGADDVYAMDNAVVSFSFSYACEAARCFSDVIFTNSQQITLISAVLTSRAIFQRFKNCMTTAVSCTIYAVLSFSLIVLIGKFNISPFMILLVVILNDVTTMTLSMDCSEPSGMPDAWLLKEIIGTGVLIGSYLALMTVFFFVLARETNLFSELFNVRSLVHDKDAMMSVLYLQVSIISQALIFVTRIRSWCPVKCPGLLLFAAFVVSQLVSTLIAVYANWGFASIKGVGWGWAGVIWLYSGIIIFALGLKKFFIDYILSRKAWCDLFI